METETYFGSKFILLASIQCVTKAVDEAYAEVDFIDDTICVFEHITDDANFWQINRFLIRPV